MRDERRSPDEEWPRCSPAEAGFDEEKLRAVADWFEQTAETSYRVALVRRGHLISVWHRGMDLEQKHGIGSGQKTLYGCVLAIAVEEGKIGSADDRVVDYFPRMMDVPDGRGPRPGRHVIPEDRGITFRQLITNTSGYLKPAETPGRAFNYLTFGMNLLTHAIEQVYGCYDPTGTTLPPGFGALVQEKIGDPLGVAIECTIGNFDLPPQARVDVFGNAPNLHCTLQGWTRIAHMWLNRGNWKDVQVVPEPWLAAGTRTSELVRACSPEEDWCYGHAFWCNDYDRRWPGLPGNSFSASGAGYNFVWVCPGLDLIVVQNPGGGPEDFLKATPDPRARAQRTEDQYQREYGLLRRVVDSLAE